MVGDSGISMAGGTIVGGMIVGGWSAVGVLSSALRCLKADEAVAAEVVVESPLNSMPPEGSTAVLDAELRPASAFFLLSPPRRSRSEASVSLPSVMTATPPKLCHGSHSHCGGRKMTKTTDAIMSEMPSTAIVGAAETRNTSEEEGGPR